MFLKKKEKTFLCLFLGIIFLSFAVSPVTGFNYVLSGGIGDNSSHIIIEKVEDYIKLIKHYSIENVFLEKTDLIIQTGNSRYASFEGMRNASINLATLSILSESSYTINYMYYFPVQAVFYVLNGNYYKTLEDYQAGNILGFKNGAEFYHANNMDCTDKETYDRVNDNNFLNYSDFITAKENGFLESPTYSEVLLPAEITEEDFILTYLPNMIRSEIRRGRFKITSESHKNIITEIDKMGFIENREQYNWNDGRNRVRGIKGTISKDVPAYFLDNIVSALSDAVIDRMKSDNKTQYYGYTISEGLYIKNERASKHYGNSSVHYYIAKMQGITKYSDYINAVEASSLGFKSIEDYLDAKRYGFENGKDYYPARDVGFQFFEDYKNARKAGCKTYEEYLPIKKIIDRYEEIVEKYKLDQYQQAVVVKTMLDIGTGKVLSLTRFIEEVNKVIASNPRVKRISYSYNPIDLKWLERFMNRYKDNITMVGKIDFENQVFLRQ